jgi:3-hydroxyisobutyrate dehydrogenase-like beta-hydroxyacid dehydrogenase
MNARDIHLAEFPIGIIGLGRMGLPIAQRLQDRGFQMLGFDLSRERCHLALDVGIAIAPSLPELIHRCKIILVCVLGGDAVIDIVNTIESNQHDVPHGGTLVDLSTTPFQLTKKLAQRLRVSCAIGWVDAPVSGGPTKASQGNLALMAGGCGLDLKKVMPLLKYITKHPVHMGPTGAGQAAKMVNQLLALSNYCLLAEAIELARSADVNLSLIPQALKGGHADSVLLQDVFPGMASHHYGMASRIGQMADDLRTLINYAHELGIALPVATRVHQLYEQAVEEGYEDLAGPALAAYYDHFWEGLPS